VQGVVEGFPHAAIHPEAWVRNTPTSSMPAHLLLCGVRELEAREEVAVGVAEATAWRVRECFFRDCADVSARNVLLACAERAGAPANRVEPLLDDGRAHAALSADLELARELDVRASPTLTFNEGRQRLAGNVGYRIIEANVRELIERPEGGSSWC
jgi:predicted DsbA family dithiol-disulfide isomerase